MPNEPIAPPTKKIKLGISTEAASFFTKTSQKPKSELLWHIHKDTLLTAKYKDGRDAASHEAAEEPRKIKIAAFDLDGTLIKTRAGGRFPKDETDWTFFDVRVPLTLRELYESGHQIVIFSNQAGLKLTDTAKRYAQFKLKLKAITSSINVPLLLYAASAHDIFRKPRTGMMEKLIHDLTDLHPDDKLDILMSQSFLVGDAAGRPASAANVRQDFSASDRKFALNAGLKFHTPEEFFKGKAQQSYELDGFDPIKFVNPAQTDHLFVRPKMQEIVLLVGSPAAGKSSYYNMFLKPLGYERINQDTLKTRQKCLAKAKEELVAGHSICVDNTNANKETRANWLQLAGQFGEQRIPVRVIHFTAPVSLCAHNNAVRVFAPRDGEEKRELLPSVAFTSYTGRYETPLLAEGFSKLDTVDFVLTGTVDEQRAWRQYWT